MTTTIGRSKVFGTVGFMVLALLVSVQGAGRFPDPARDSSRAAAKDIQTAVVAGGCFWGVEAVFEQLTGVVDVVSGYAGGPEKSAHYEMVGTGQTGHAESVKITYDASQVTYGQLLKVFFSVAHDPTELNRQGPDEGPQYRSAIFPANEDQARVAKAYITQLNDARAFPANVVTAIEPGRLFHRAEDYHQDFLEHNRSNRYIVVNDLPKLAALKRLFPSDYRARPILSR